MRASPLQHARTVVRCAGSAAQRPKSNTSMPKHTKAQVAIIGGGLSGLACAQKLKDLGISSTVFDTGKNAPGGRCSSREIVQDGHVLRFDHSMQCFSASSEGFGQVVKEWISAGVVQPWDGSVVGTVNAGGEFQPRGNEAPLLYVGVERGNKAIVDHLSQGLDIDRPVWVSRVQRQPGGKWDVYEYRDFQGAFDYIVVAHNGKCADRLMSTAGVPGIHKLLKVRFQPAPTPAPVMQLCSIWVLMVAFPKSLGLPLEGCFVKGVPEISWIANNTAKMAKTQASPNDLECWTIISSRTFGAQHKVPQEFVPPLKDVEVKSLLMKAFEKAVGRELPKPCFQKAQLWGAAVPMNTLETPEGCCFDAQANVGICGDWLVSPSVEGCIVSGHAMAEKIASHASGNDQSSVGLDATFKICSTPAIGDFPGTDLKNDEIVPDMRKLGGGNRGGRGQGRGRGRGGGRGRGQGRGRGRGRGRGEGNPSRSGGGGQNVSSLA
ncbi:hypothetical protein BSKO_08617 [Bryopsis sp. KO-2023]|nr:hypothetical protein BSKO_08617 [Bryopsis sp. KO-2023]